MKMGYIFIRHLIYPIDKHHIHSASRSWIGGLGEGWGLTWIPCNSFGLFWTQLDPLGLTWAHLDSLGPTWTHFDSLGLIWTHLDSLGLSPTHLDSLGLTWILFVSLGPTGSHKGKGKGRWVQKEKGKRGRMKFALGILFTSRNRAAHARTKRNDFLVSGGAFLKANSLPPTSDIYIYVYTHMYRKGKLYFAPGFKSGSASLPVSEFLSLTLDVCLSATEFF
jgi:hypothetical protein